MANYYSIHKGEIGPDSSLCCCEYVNHEKKRFHILACCCNCEYFDQVFTDWLTRRPIDQSLVRNMLLTFQDRLRIPWRGGARQIAFGTIVPIFVVPLVISLAAINAYTFTVILLACTMILCYALNYVQRSTLRTRFFGMWMLSSLFYLVALFELTVPLLEVLPEENCVLVAFSAISLICFYQTYRRSYLNNFIPSTGTEKEKSHPNEGSNKIEDPTQTVLLLEQNSENAPVADGVNDYEPNMCSICRKYVPAHTGHCMVCGACIKRYDHHSYWLNCCIGESNHRFYIAGLTFGILALLLGANLTLTAVCHPFLVTNILGVQILLPDDCSEVFDMYELGLAFVIAVYALLMAAYIMIILMRQLYIISRGITLYECKKGQRGNNKTLKFNCRNFMSLSTN